MARSRPALLQPGLGLSLADDPGVIGALVFVLDARQQLFGLSGADGVASGESVGDRQKQSDQRILIFRVDFQHIQADALGRARLVEEAVKMRPLEGLRDGVFVNLLQIEHGASNECAAICHTAYAIFHMKIWRTIIQYSTGCMWPAPSRPGPRRNTRRRSIR